MLDLYISSKSGVDQLSCGKVNQNCRTIDYALKNNYASDSNEHVVVYLDEDKYKSFKIKICSNFEIHKSKYSRSKPEMEDGSITLCDKGNKAQEARIFKILSVNLNNVNVTFNAIVNLTIIKAVIANSKTIFHKPHSKIIIIPRIKQCYLVLATIVRGKKLCYTPYFKSSSILINSSIIDNSIFNVSSLIDLHAKNSTFVNTLQNRKSIFTFNYKAALWISDSIFSNNNIEYIFWSRTWYFTYVHIINSRFQYNILSAILKGIIFFQNEFFNMNFLNELDR